MAEKKTVLRPNKFMSQQGDIEWIDESPDKKNKAQETFFPASQPCPDKETSLDDLEEPALLEFDPYHAKNGEFSSQGGGSDDGSKRP
jgi:hypothetical protein